MSHTLQPSRPRPDMTSRSRSLVMQEISGSFVHSKVCQVPVVMSSRHLGRFNERSLELDCSTVNYVSSNSLRMLSARKIAVELPRTRNNLSGDFSADEWALLAACGVRPAETCSPKGSLLPDGTAQTWLQ